MCKSGNGAFWNAIFSIYPLFPNSCLEHGPMAKGKTAILDHKASLRMEMIEETESLIAMELPHQLLMPTCRLIFL